MEVVKGITAQTILLVVDKTPKMKSLSIVMNNLGFKTFSSNSVYDALRLTDQELPHLIISDAVLSDGTVGTLYDRLKQQSHLANVPILALVASKTKEQLTPLKGRQFAGFILGRIEGQSLSGKVTEILASTQNLSPYFLKSDDVNLDNKITLSLDAIVLGRSGSQIVYQSRSEVDNGASLVCLPNDKSKKPALLKMGTNVVKDKAIYNLFPISRIKGKGRKWILDLPDINLAESGTVREYQILFFDPQAKRAEQFQEVLGGYGTILNHVSSFKDVLPELLRNGGRFSCVYLDEIPTSSSGIQFKEALAKIPQGEKPPVIAGTASMTARSTTEIKYISKPFGLGVLVEALQSAFKSKDSFTSQESANIEVTYQVPASILGLDETGGIVQMKYPMYKGSQVNLVHEDLNEIWEGENQVEISEVGVLENKPDTWQARFTSPRAIGNKSKYLQTVQDYIKQQLDTEIESI